MCLGDFNDISHHHEKERGRKKSQRPMNEFNAMIEDISMEDLEENVQLFTWSNNRKGENRLYEHLDRVLVNSRWATQYPKRIA